MIPTQLTKDGQVNSALIASLRYVGYGQLAPLFLLPSGAVDLERSGRVDIPTPDVEQIVEHSIGAIPDDLSYTPWANNAGGDPEILYIPKSARDKWTKDRIVFLSKFAGTITLRVISYDERR